VRERSMPSFIHDLLLVLAGGGSVAAITKLIEKLLDNRIKMKIHNDDREDRRNEGLETLRKEMAEGLDERERKGKERFDINSKLIEENSMAINKLTDKVDSFSDDVRSSVTTIAKNTEVMGNGVKSVLFDKITIIYTKCLSRCDGGAITSDEAANLQQLYLSYSGLGGNGAGHEMYNTAYNMKRITKEEADRLDLRR
jgi:hypothetical protein